MLTGNFVSPWFQKNSNKKDKDSHYSKPLSDVTIFPQAAQSVTIPAFAYSMFDATNLISQLSLYLDRYRFVQQLVPAADNTNVVTVATYAAEAKHKKSEVEQKKSEHEQKK